MVAVMDLMEAFSVEMTGKDVEGITQAAPLLPPGTRVNVTFLGNEDLAMRLTAARAVRDAGLTPVPHFSARRVQSREHFVEYLEALRDQRTLEAVFAVGGDPHRPEGPYEDSLALIRSGLFPEYGVTDVGIGGYPEGHPDIDDATLWAALVDKSAAIDEQGLSGTIITQFGFDVDPVLAWAQRVRDRGIEVPIRVGVPGPAGVKRLLAFAGRFGIASSAGIARKYGFSLTNLLGTAGPDHFIRDLAERWDPQRHGVLELHFYTFGGVPATSEWIDRFEKSLV